MDNYILSYYQAIKSGEICVGRWVLLWYEKIIAGLQAGEFFFSPKKAALAVMFIERFCRHHEGELAPQHIKLELWQKAMVSVLFGITEQDGTRFFREAFISMGRKNGKTLLAAAISVYMAFLDGEYGGRIYFAAPKLEQAGLCFEAFYQMIKTEDTLAGRAKRRRTDVYIEESNTTAKPLAFSAKKSDGLNISLCVADEVASWGGDQGLKFYEVLKSSFGARKQPLLLSISTAGYLNDGVYDELMKRSTAVLLGNSKETRLAPFLYIIDDESKCFDINELRKSNPNLGVSCPVSYLLEEIAIAEGSLPKRAEFLTKYCCVKQNSSTAWLEFKDVENCLGEPLDFSQFADCYCVCGLDLSQTTDLTSACCVIEKDGVLNVISHFWMPTNRIEMASAEDGVPYDAYVRRGFLSLSGDNYIDYHDVETWLTDLVTRWKLYPLKLGYDRYSAQYLIAELKAFGFQVDDVFQGFNLTPVIQEMGGMVKDGKINIGDNGLLQSHLLNSALKMDMESKRMKLVKVGTRTRIDGTAALLDALTVRQKWYAEIGAQLKNER